MSKSSTSSAMRIILVLAVLVIILVFVGWLRLSAPEGNPTIQLDTSEVEEDTGTAVEKGREAVQGISEQVEEQTDEDAETEIEIEAEVEEQQQ